MNLPASHPRLAKTLTYAGTLPLIGCALFAWVPGYAGMDVATIALTYGAVIAAFISGIHWAASLFFAERCGSLPMIASNAITLLAWSALLIGSPVLDTSIRGAPMHGATIMACLLLALCFASLLAVDRSLYAKAVLPLWFFRLRRNATLIVISMLLLVAAAQP